jgi:hypothetical protein
MVLLAKAYSAAFLVPIAKMPVVPCTSAFHCRDMSLTIDHFPAEPPAPRACPSFGHDGD